LIILSACSTEASEPSHYPVPQDWVTIHTPLIGTCRTIFPSANGVHQTLWTGSTIKLFRCLLRRLHIFSLKWKS